MLNSGCVTDVLIYLIWERLSSWWLNYPAVGVKTWTLRTYVPGSVNSHYFHIIGDGHQPKSVGVYIPIIRSPIKGGMTIPNIVTFDHVTYEKVPTEQHLNKLQSFMNPGWWSQACGKVSIANNSATGAVSSKSSVTNLCPRHRVAFPQFSNCARKSSGKSEFLLGRNCA